MPTLHRLQWIDAQIRSGQYPNAKSLAAAFEISRRQALRDFDYLRDSLGAPLAYSALHRGFTYTHQSFTLPGPYVTESQRAALGHLATYYADAAERDQAAGPVFADLAGLFRRLGGSVAPRSLSQAERAVPLMPYRARLSGYANPLPELLRPYFRGSPAPGEAAFEFHDPEAFLGALWGAPGFRVEAPRWLRERLLARLSLLQNTNADMTRHVTPPLVPSSQAPGAKPGSSTRRDPIMEKNRNEVSARFERSWMSYIGAVQGILNSAGMGPWDYWKLMGATGMAFHLVMHERCCISSVTVYDWMNTHLMALDRIGILSEAHEALPGSPTYEAACRRGLVRIKESIDRGAGVVLWGVDTGEFGVVYGYDDADGVLLADGCFGPNGKPILYENLGRTFPDAPILHYQLILEQVPADQAQTARSALQYYVDLMERPSHVARGYQSGLLAYDNWVRGLQTEGYDQRGCRYAAFVYAEAKDCGARYLEHLAQSDKALAPAAAAFRRTASLYDRMMGVLEQNCADPGAMGKPVTAEQVGALLPLLREAKQSEAETVALVKRYLTA